MNSIISKYEKQIAGTISCFDRLIISGTLQTIAYDKNMSWYLYNNKIQIFGYTDFAQQIREKIKDAVMTVAERNNIKIQYLTSYRTRKEALVHEILETRGEEPGLVCIFSATEGCHTYRPFGNKEKGHPELKYTQGRCLHYYIYFIDPSLGLCYLRIPTYLPCRLQFYCNGHDILQREMDKENIEYVKEHNSFTRISDYDKAQELANLLDPKTIVDRLQKYVKALCPIENIFGDQYYWCVSQAEYSTDIIFKRSKTLTPIYNDLITTAMHSITIEDVCSFLGRHNTHNLTKEGGSSLKSVYEGRRLKHTYGKAAIKMYDKNETMIRIETTVNDPGMFVIYKKDQNGKAKSSPLRKGISNLMILAERMNSANKRYIHFISAIETREVGIRKLEQITQAAVVKSKRYRGFNFFRIDDNLILDVITRGNFTINGFRNADIRKHLTDKNTGQVSRIIKRLTSHKIIKKAAHSYKYYLTKRGAEVTLMGLKLKEMYLIPKLAYVKEEEYSGQNAQNF